MADPRDRIRDELKELVSEGQLLFASETLKTHKGIREAFDAALAEVAPATSSKAKGGKAQTKKNPVEELRGRLVQKETFGQKYQSWYTRALRVVQQVLPDRYDEFRELHRLDKRPKELDVATYSISDYIQGIQVTRGILEELVFEPAPIALGKFNSQVEILGSAEARLDSALADIEGSVEAGLIDDELEAARELLRLKFLRSAGVVAGVVLERHLKRAIANHAITFRKKAQIANLNDALKEAGVIDVPEWRRIQRLGDIRNLCGHDGEREPTREEVDELITGVERVSTTIF